MESYIGLVEVGVGLIPAGGGLTYIARRAAEMASAVSANVDLLKFLTDRFTSAAMARVGTSAIESRKMGYLLRERRHRAEQGRAAVRRDAAGEGDGRGRLARAGAGAVPGGRPQRHRHHQGASSSTCATAASSARTTSTSPRLIAEVVCGGDVDAGSLVTEEYLMTLERQALLRAARPSEDAGTDHGHAADRQAGAQLKDTDMSKQVQDAYIVAATRTPIGKSRRGYFRNTRPDDLLVAAILSAMAQVPGLDPEAIEDAIIGCSIPEAEQGLNMARIAVLLCGLPKPVGGITVNRFCASGLTAVQMAADRIRVGEADVMIAGGAESMSMVPMSGNKPSFNPEIFARDENVGIAYGMGLTAEKVAAQWKVSREAQDAFALESHLRRWRRRRPASSRDEITPIEVIDRCPTSPAARSRPAPAPSTSTKARARTPRPKAWPS